MHFRFQYFWIFRLRQVVVSSIFQLFNWISPISFFHSVFSVFGCFRQISVFCKISRIEIYPIRISDSAFFQISGPTNQLGTSFVNLLRGRLNSNILFHLAAKMRHFELKSLQRPLEGPLSGFFTIRKSDTFRSDYLTDLKLYRTKYILSNITISVFGLITTLMLYQVS